MTAAAWLAALAGTQAAGQAPDPTRIAASFVADAQQGTAPGAGALQLVKANAPMLKFAVRPERTVTLAEAVPAPLAAQIGAEADAPLDTARQLHGWPSGPARTATCCASAGWAYRPRACAMPTSTATSTEVCGSNSTGAAVICW